MRSEFYKPKELLSMLVEVDDRLKNTIEKHCPDQDLKLSDDVDGALNDFLQLSDIADDDVAYLSSQLALLHLRKEIEKAIEVIVDVNALRAHHDFSTVTPVSPSTKESSYMMPKTLLFKWLIAALVLAFVLLLLLLRVL